MKILVVEDEADFAQLVSEILSEDQHTVTVSPRWYDLSPQYLAQFDLVIGDVYTPAQTAFEWLTGNEGLAKQSHLPYFIFMSGNLSAPKTLETSLRMIDDSLTQLKNSPIFQKPFSISSLKAKVDSIRPAILKN